MDELRERGVPVPHFAQVLKLRAPVPSGRSSARTNTLQVELVLF
jgi:hypothetical protein